MKKNQHLFITVALVTSLVIYLSSCHKEENSIANDNEFNSFKFSQKSFTDAFVDNKFKDAYLKTFQNQNNNFDKSSSDDVYNFSIDSSRVKQIDFQGVTTYTMLIKRPISQVDLFENLVIKIDEKNNISAFILKYKLKETINYIDFHNSFNFNADIEITVLDYNKLQTTKQIEQNCYDVVVTYCSQTGLGDSGTYYYTDHVVGPDCHHPEYFYTKIEEHCEEVGFAGGSDSSSSGGGGDSNNETIITAPVFNESEILALKSFINENLNVEEKEYYNHDSTIKNLIDTFLQENDFSGFACFEAKELLDFGQSLNLNSQQFNWAFNNRNSQTLSNVTNFLNQNSFSQEAKEFAKLAVQAFIDGGDFDSINQVIIDSTLVNNERLNCVYNKFKNGENNISQYLDNFLKDNSVGHLKISSDDDFQNNYSSNFWNAGAITKLPENYIIEIVFNSDPNLSSSEPNMPTIILALELIHEMVHAEMFRKLLSCAQLPNVNWHNFTEEQWKNFINNLANSYEGIYDYYIRYFLDSSSPSNYQHQQMAQHYVNTIADALADFDNNQHSENFYQNLAWTGLQNTVAWNNLSTTQQNEIQNTITNAIQNEPHECYN